jgi:hypothetical protein
MWLGFTEKRLIALRRTLAWDPVEGYPSRLKTHVAFSVIIAPLLRIQPASAARSTPSASRSAPIGQSGIGVAAEFLDEAREIAVIIDDDLAPQFLDGEQVRAQLLHLFGQRVAAAVAVRVWSDRFRFFL